MSVVTLPSAVSPGRIYEQLRRELADGGNELSASDRDLLRRHYPQVAAYQDISSAAASGVFALRRSVALHEMTRFEAPMVLDAGCGCGTDAILFASNGARVLAVDADAGKVALARRRAAAYQALLGRSLDIVFEVADLDRFEAPPTDITWIASVLAAVRDQDKLLAGLHRATRPGGCVIVTDMNLRNPLFVACEWRRRRRAAALSAAFAAEASFADMLRRRHRHGARSFPFDDGSGEVDDVQFFSATTLARLFRSSGFERLETRHYGFVPPQLGSLTRLEPLLARVPLLRSLGYFYVVTAYKPAA